MIILYLKKKPKNNVLHPVQWGWVHRTRDISLFPYYSSDVSWGNSPSLLLLLLLLRWQKGRRKGAGRERGGERVGRVRLDSLPVYKSSTELTQLVPPTLVGVTVVSKSSLHQYSCQFSCSRYNSFPRFFASKADTKNLFPAPKVNWPCVNVRKTQLGSSMPPFSPHV